MSNEWQSLDGMWLSCQRGQRTVRSAAPCKQLNEGPTGSRTSATRGNPGSGVAVTVAVLFYYSRQSTAHGIASFAQPRDREFNDHDGSVM